MLIGAILWFASASSGFSLMVLALLEKANHGVIAFDVGWGVFGFGMALLYCCAYLKQKGR